MRAKILAAPMLYDWDMCKVLTLGTVGKMLAKPADDAFKHMITKSEHSPLRAINVIWEWEDIPYWVSVHLVRHHVGITPFVSTQRNDRQDKYDRNEAPQGALVLHRCTANLQSILDISQVRLCRNAAPETREAWIAFLDALACYEPEFVQYCVPKCIYRNGLCGEPKQCAHGVDAKELKRYQRLFKRTV